MAILFSRMGVLHARRFVNNFVWFAKRMSACYVLMAICRMMQETASTGVYLLAK